ncbi:MAG: PEP-CTERM sorting domain-containing protein [Halioglobus sp.]|nr:PEP-CTERM sorting domain-containing protein [Halioglobus sp.]
MEYRLLATSGVLFAAVGLAAPTSAAVVNSFAPFTPTPTAGVWFESGVLGTGTASVVSLAGEGGNLENNQPLPVGAARLTTGFDNGDKAEVAVVDAYGNARALFSDSFSLDYSYYKQDVGNAFAAPSIKLTLRSAVCNSGDCFGTLIYEPSWNQSGSEGSSTAVPTDDWESVSITADSGLFWWNGGFGQTNSSGGPPLKTLTDWMAAFDSDFDSADLLALSMGVGTYNQGQDTYFDDVSISGNGYSASYDFEPAADVPVPSTLLLVAIGALAGVSARRRPAR